MCASNPTLLSRFQGAALMEWVDVAAAVVVRPSSRAGGCPRVLIGHRLPNVHLPDYWEFPGGKLEPGETSGECASREVWEETGVRVQTIAHLVRQEHEYPDRRVRIDFHFCRYLGGVPQPIACQAVRWVRLDDLDIYPFPNANGEILGALAAGDFIELLGSASSPGGPNGAGIDGSARRSR